MVAQQHGVHRSWSAGWAAATTTELLYSQPDTQTTTGTRVLTSATFSGASASYSTFATLPDQIGASTENAVAISTGTGGFAAGTTYTTAIVNGSTPVILREPGNTVFVTLPVTTTAASRPALTFDTVGTFGFSLIVSTSSGVIGYSSAGTILFSYTVPTGVGTVEGVTVAPITNAACPGCLYLVSSATSGGAGAVLTVAPNTPSGSVATPVSSMPITNPEGISFVPSSLLTFDGYAYFLTGFTAPAGESDTWRTASSSPIWPVN